MLADFPSGTRARITIEGPDGDTCHFIGICTGNRGLIPEDKQAWIDLQHKWSVWRVVNLEKLSPNILTAFFD